ncbi:hypothetical protein [Methyloglobulus sp.]|uniref:hypothetical protein n=1 Tax=Methyloglobulus sp. TaxID=2518622 RepID=UPI003989A88D
MKYFRSVMTNAVFLICAALLSGCVVPSSYYPEQNAYNQNTTPQNRADELIQRVAGGPLGHTVRIQNENGNYSAEATVLKEYQSDGRACKEVHHKVIFENKAIENKSVSVCLHEGVWYLPETRVAQQQRQNPYRQANPMFPYAQQPAWAPMGYGYPIGGIPPWQRGLYMNQPGFYGGFQFSR